MKMSIEDSHLLKTTSNKFEIISFLNFINKQFNLKEKNIVYKINFTLENKNNIIDSINFNRIDNLLEIFINHHGFFGTKGILPDFLLEKILQEKNEDFMNFFNIFFNKIFTIYIDIIKSRFFLNKNKLYSNIFQGFNLRAGNSKYFYGFQHLILNDFVSSTSLNIILRNILNNNVKIVSNTGKYQNINEKDRAVICKYCNLGMNKILGKRYFKPSSKIDIIIDLEDSKKLFETIKILNSEKIKNIIEIYLNKKSDYSIYISTYPNFFAILTKGENKIKLGMNAFLKSNLKNKILYKILT